MHDFTTLNIQGSQGTPLANTFVRQAEAARHLAILLPGVAYTTDMPLLYYSRLILLERGADALSLEADYHRQADFRTLEPEEQYRRLTADTMAACAAALSQRAYEQVTVVGKSLGTLAMGYLAANEERLRGANWVWLTPLLKEPALRQQILAARPRSLFVAGGADPLYDAGHQRQAALALAGQSVVIEGANHSLEVPGNLQASLRALGEVVEAVRRFIP